MGNGLVVTKEGKTTERKRKKGKKTSPEAKGKEETAAAATKEEKKDDKPQVEPNYCFRCGVEGHKVAGCEHKGDLKCENHPNHTSHMTEACNITRIKKGLPLHSFMAAKRNPSHSGNQLTLEPNSSFEGALDDSLTIFSGGESPPQDHTGCSIFVESLGTDSGESDYSSTVSSGDETDSETSGQPNFRKPYRQVLRTNKGGRRRLKKGGHEERITGSIRLSEYVTCKASTIETPSYSLLITSKTPSPNLEKKVTKTTVLLDTGASISLLPLWKAQELGVDIKEKRDVRVLGADGKLLAVVGIGHIFVRDPDATFWKLLTVVVTKDVNHC